MSKSDSDWWLGGGGAGLLEVLNLVEELNDKYELEVDLVKDTQGRRVLQVWLDAPVRGSSRCSGPSSGLPLPSTGDALIRAAEAGAAAHVACRSLSSKLNGQTVNERKPDTKQKADTKQKPDTKNNNKQKPDTKQKVNKQKVPDTKQKVNKQKVLKQKVKEQKARAIKQKKVNEQKVTKQKVNEARRKQKVNKQKVDKQKVNKHKVSS